MPRVGCSRGRDHTTAEFAQREPLEPLEPRGENLPEGWVLGPGSCLSGLNVLCDRFLIGWGGLSWICIYRTFWDVLSRVDGWLCRCHRVH